jgi:hypothetical protein
MRYLWGEGGTFNIFYKSAAQVMTQGLMTLEDAAEKGEK